MLELLEELSVDPLLIPVLLAGAVIDELSVDELVDVSSAKAVENIANKEIDKRTLIN